MGFTSFLKKAGIILAKLALAEAGVALGVKQADPNLGPKVDKLDQIFQSIVAVEGMFEKAYPGQQTGAQKLAAAGTLVAPILNQVQVLTGAKVGDSAQYTEGINTIITGIVKMLNSSDGNPQAVLPVIAAPAAATAPVVTSKPA